MKSFVFVSSVFAALAAASPLEQRAAPGCNADNCLRALTVTDSNLLKTRPALARSDCSVYAQITSTLTFTPAVSTVYLTSTTVTSSATTTFTTGTETVTVVVPTTMVIQSFVKRAYPDINPNDPAGLYHDTPLERRALAVPSYASACSNVARFASACSCAFGVFPTTTTVSITLPAQSITLNPTVTSTAISTETDTLTETVSTTTTSILATSTAISAFKIRASGSPVDNYYLTNNVVIPGANIPFFSASAPSHVTCTLSPTNRNLVCDNQIVHIIGTGQFFQIRNWDDRHKLQCQIDSVTRELTCDPISSPDIPHPTGQWFACRTVEGSSGSQWFLMQGFNAVGGCLPISVFAEPV